MASMPVHTVTTISRHQWVIGEESTPTTARELDEGIHFAQSQMEDLGIDISHDDSYLVKAGDGGQVILYVDVEVSEK